MHPQGLIQLYVEAEKWDDAFLLLHAHPECRQDVCLPYAKWLANQDRCGRGGGIRRAAKEGNRKRSAYGDGGMGDGHCEHAVNTCRVQGCCGLQEMWSRGAGRGAWSRHCPLLLWARPRCACTPRDWPTRTGAGGVGENLLGTAGGMPPSGSTGAPSAPFFFVQRSTM